MECLICYENSENKNCLDCNIRKRGKECCILKFKLYNCKNGSSYGTCIDCFN